MVSQDEDQRDAIMALTDFQVKNVKPKSAPIKRSDGDNVYRLIQPNNGK